MGDGETEGLEFLLGNDVSFCGYGKRNGCRFVVCFVGGVLVFEETLFARNSGIGFLAGLDVR